MIAFRRWSVAKKNAPPTGTRRTREHVIADLAVNHTERQALLCGFTVERIRADYGIDLLLFSFDSNGEVENGYVSIQVKATESLDWLASEPAAAFRIGRKDLVGWLRQSLPVILVAYDAKEDRAYWVHVQGYFAAQPGFNVFSAAQTITVRVPRQNVLDPAAVRQFVELRDRTGRE
jgi:hypothetical protein